jgi:ABC-type Fe3+/spermidine/putrescine transport system ATPase subunit
MSGVELHDVTKEYGSQRAVDTIDIVIAKGEFMTLLGPSGCGKTTTLRMVAGFVTPSSGTIRIAGRDVTRVPANDRNTGMVFQSFALFPHLTVAENVAFGLRVRKVDRGTARRRVQDAIRLVRLEGFEHRLPRQMSGGQQQRVALARAVVINPDVLLLDEPLSALDLQLRHELQMHIRTVQQELGVTTIYVTHDQGEALRMSDRIAVMRNGRIVQLDAPQDLYRRPGSPFVAKFIGQANVVDVDVLGRDEGTGAHMVALARDPAVRIKVAHDGGDAAMGAGPAALIFRPEVAVCGGAQENRIEGTVLKRAYSGSVWSLTLACAGATELHIDLPYTVTPPPEQERFEFCFRPEDCRLVPREAL